MEFIKLTDYQNQPIYVKASAIEVVYPRVQSELTTLIQLTTKSIYVLETQETILELIEEIEL